VVAESVQALHSQWSKQMETELQQACDKIQLRGREVDEVSQALSASALDKLQRAMEASRRDSVDRIIARLKEQSTPLLENAQKVMAELNRCTQDMSPAIETSLEESTARIEQTHAQLEKQFEKAIRDRLEAAHAEFTRAARAATIEALNDLRGLSQKHEAEVKARLQKAIEPILEENLLALREKAKETSQQFAGEIDNYSRSHLEFVGGAISELAKGLGKKARE
jgi:ABC-type transporter Mla subunit MlaD